MKKEIMNFLWKKMQENKTEEISWHYVRKFVDSDEESDENCRQISEEFGLKIKYKGGIIEY